MTNFNIPRPIPESYWVLPDQFLAGEYPGHWMPEQARQRIDDFLQAGFDTFIDLTRPNELEPYENILKQQALVFQVDALYQRFPIGDFGLPSIDQMQKTLDVIDSAIAAQRKIFVHCWGGIGRTGTTVGCYLVRHGLSGAQALDQLAEWWRDVPKSARFPHSPETKAQMRFILNWQEGSGANA